MLRTLLIVAAVAMPVWCGWIIVGSERKPQFEGPATVTLDGGAVIVTIDGFSAFHVPHRRGSNKWLGVETGMGFNNWDHFEAAYQLWLFEQARAIPLTHPAPED